MTYVAPLLAWGPWIGIAKDRQKLCAIDGCTTQGAPQRCFADETMHHHGCVHYDGIGEALYAEHKLKIRHGWGLLCHAHYALAVAVFEKTCTKSSPPP